MCGLVSDGGVMSNDQEGCPVLVGLFEQEPYGAVLCCSPSERSRVRVRAARGAHPTGRCRSASALRRWLYPSPSDTNRIAVRIRHR